MSNVLLDLSFGVKRSDGYVSDIWRASTTRLGDFHLATSSIAGVEEYRFNKSGICRSAHSGADSAPACGATYVEFAFAAEPEQGIRGVLDIMQDRTLVRCAALPNGETLVIFCYHADWENKDLHVPGNGAAADVLFSADDPLASGRPLRHRLGPAPKDGEAVLLLEMGGVAVTN